MSTWTGGSDQVSLPKTEDQLIRCLADGELHSGEDLAARLGVSRAAVSKAAQRLRERLGLAIDGQPGRGYRLHHPVELLDATLMRLSLPESARGALAHLRIHAEVDSTNSRLLREARDGAPSGTLCLAERQTAGRGRHGRHWVSPYGTNIYLSLLWRFTRGPAGLGGLSLAAGTAVAAVLRREGVEDIALKWPNDVLWRRRKLAGVLVEVTAEAEGPSAVVIGVGINTRLAGTEAGAIDQPWVDLAEILGSAADRRNRIAAGLAAALTEVCQRYAEEGLAPFLPAWEAWDRHRGERVMLNLGERQFSGIHLGISAQGALRLDLGGEGVREFQAGEVSLRATGGDVARRRPEA